LSATEFRILRVLCQHPGRLYSRSQLMDQAWTEPETALERTVDAHIKSLRAKLRAVRPELDPIETRRGLGYSLKERW
jgi:two-component system, OmpR family, catabolic regulation response regulator CreB